METLIVIQLDKLKSNKNIHYLELFLILFNEKLIMLSSRLNNQLKPALILVIGRLLIVSYDKDFYFIS
jgi:hypothetical protein